MSYGYDDLFIKTANSDEISITDNIQGLKFLGIETDPAFVNTYQTIVGVDGSQLQAADIAKNKLTANFWLQFGDYQDFLLAKRKISHYLGTKQPLRIRTGTQAGLCAFVLPDNFTIKPSQPGSHNAVFSIPFDNPSGYYYSVLRSDEINSNNDELQIGMNLPNQQLDYHFNTTSFQVYNAGDVVVDPYYQHNDLRISLTFTGNYCQIVNNTNGSEWKYNSSSSGKDNIVINGINTTDNNTPCSLSTDYGNIILNTGWNDITINGTSAIDITFSFPFIYMC